MRFVRSGITLEIGSEEVGVGVWMGLVALGLVVKPWGCGLNPCPKKSKAEHSMVQGAMHSAGLRMVETLRSEPLFHDPYAACLAPRDLLDGMNEMRTVSNHGRGEYEIATKFIDDTLLDFVKRKNLELRQVVLLTDGMDTRPYRLPWPPATMIYDVSYSPVFELAKTKLSAIGAKIPKACFLRHISLELEDLLDWQHWIESVKDTGYQGHKPGIWCVQGLDYLMPSGLESLLFCVSSLAAKDTIFVGELSASCLGVVSLESRKEQLEKLFLRHGFRVRTIALENIAQNLSCPIAFSNLGNPSQRVIFTAQKLLLSDDELAKAKREMELFEESGDEETFEDW